MQSLAASWNTVSIERTNNTSMGHPYICCVVGIMLVHCRVVDNVVPWGRRFNRSLARSYTFFKLLFRLALPPFYIHLVFAFAALSSTTIPAFPQPPFYNPCFYF